MHDLKSTNKVHIIKDGLNMDPKKYYKMREKLVGVSEENTTGMKKLYWTQVTHPSLSKKA